MDGCLDRPLLTPVEESGSFGGGGGGGFGVLPGLFLAITTLFFDPSQRPPVPHNLSPHHSLAIHFTSPHSYP